MVKGIDKAGRGAFCATVAIVGLLLAGPAFAGPPENNGSIDVVTSCSLEGNQLTVTAQVMDVTNDDGSAIIDKIEFTCEQKTAPGRNGREACTPTEIVMDFDPDMDLANGVIMQNASFTVDLLSAREAKGNATVFCTNCRKNVSDSCDEVVIFGE
jgi:hypothetical protein